MDKHGGSDWWKEFTATGDILDYLYYKSQQGGCALESENHGDSDNGPGVASGQGGRGRSDPDDFDA